MGQTLYEKIWNEYARKFGKTPGTIGFEHLGDEWGTIEQ